MSTALKEILDNISLMIVMTSPGDTQGVELLLSLCDDAKKAAHESGQYLRIVDAAEDLRKHTKESDIVSRIERFATAALQLIDNAGEAVFPHEAASTSGTAHPDVAESLDPAFLTEFIETHGLLLDDFESTVAEFQQSGENAADVCTFVKRYVHNLKGDSGSIGLLGLERVCHALEDQLSERGIEAAAGSLLAFKEWAVSCMKCFTQGEPPARSASDFLQTLSKDEPAPAKQPKVAAPEPEEDSLSYQLTGEPEILLEFAAEAEEHLSNVESVILESEGVFTKDAVDTIFRGVHSLKGGSAYFTLEEMTKVSHILENFLSEVRDGKRELDPKLNALLLVYIDLQKDILNRAKAALSQNGAMVKSKASIDFLESLDRYSRGKSLAVEVSEAAAGGAAAPVETEESEQKTSKLQVKDYVKVDTARLDHLIDSIGEMVIYSSMLVRQCRELLGEHQRVMDTTHRVEKFSRDLQDIGMSMRLVPIKGLFQKMSRLVWDTSKKLGKNIQFVMQGEDTELDRNLIDKLADPLMHMVRNSLDHGIETPEERQGKGKQQNGVVSLAAFHSGGSIHIQIRDDGRGLNPDKILAKAIEKGIVTPGQKLTQSEIYQLIFAPGFSTAAVVTDISGRGVGMDVVRRNVESLRGRIHIQSEVDKGSVFTIELPLTLAIIDGIEIRVGSEHFIVPSLSIVEFVRPAPNTITNTFDSGETFHFRGKYLPIFRLSSLYDIPAEFSDPCDGTIIVVENGHEYVALLVDEVLGQYSTVIKTLGPAFDDAKGLAGCAIMPSGDVALILDIRSLVLLARSVYSPACGAGVQAVQ